MKKIAMLLLLCLTLGLVPGVSAAETQNLFLNHEFTNWSARTDTATQTEYQRLREWSGTWNAGGGLSREETVVRSAPYALKIDAAKNNGDVFVYQNVEVLPATEYTVGFWFYGAPEKAGDNVGNVGVKFEFYHVDEAGSRTSVGGDLNLTLAHETDNEWTYKEASATTPQGCNQVSILIRFKSKALGYVDDASFMRTGDPQHATGLTDQIFYYKEDIDAEKNGMAEITMNAYYTAADFQAAVSLKDPDGETIFESQKQRFTEGKATVSFPLRLLTQMKTAYSLTMQVYGAEETPVWTKTQNIYGYPRPSAIGEDGQYRVGGVLFQPTVGYHINLPPSGAVPGPDTAEGTDWFDAAVEAGVNVVQLSYYYGDPDRIKAALDRCQQYGLKALICLYRNNFPAGNNTEKIKNAVGEMVTNAENTPEVVKIAKDHPATFAYALKDEPFSHMLPEAYIELEEGYRLIRNEDDVHPVWIVDNTVKSYAEQAKYTDIVGIDPYPRSAELSATYVTDRIRRAVDAAQGKPVYAVLQACRYGDTDDDGKDDYFPTGAELRHMAYQALAAGAKAIGYYAFTDPVYENGNRVALMDTDLWEPITDFAANEQEKAYVFFRNSQLLRTVETDEILMQLRSFDGESYVVVLSKKNTAQVCTTEAFDGKIEETFLGKGNSIADISDTVWTINAAPHAADIYKLRKDGLFFSKNGIIMETLESGTFTAEANLATDKDKTVTLLCALYNKTANATELVSIQDIASGKAMNGFLHLSGAVTIDAETVADEIALFLFSAGNMKPLTSGIKKKIER